jgi:hypothetical protein
VNQEDDPAYIISCRYAFSKYLAHGITEATEMFPECVEFIQKHKDETLDQVTSFLQSRLHSISKNKEEDAVRNQRQYLETVSHSAFNDLIKSYESFKSVERTTRASESKEFNELFEKIHELQLVFPFDWKNWDEGWLNLKSQNPDFTGSSIVDISMYPTALFRAGRFEEGLVEKYIRNGIFEKIFNRLSVIVHQKTQQNHV